MDQNEWPDDLQVPAELIGTTDEMQWRRHRQEARNAICEIDVESGRTATTALDQLRRKALRLRGSGDGTNE